MHWENEWPTKKQLQCKNKPSKIPTKPSQAIPYLFCPFQTPLVASIWDELWHRGFPIFMFVFTLSDIYIQPLCKATLKNWETQCFCIFGRKKSLSKTANLLFTLSLFCSLCKRANLFFTLSAEDTALPLDVSSKMDMSCLVYSMLSINKACAITVMATLHWARYPSISSFIQTLVQPLWRTVHPRNKRS